MLTTDGFMHIVSRTVVRQDGSLQLHATINLVGITGVDPFGVTQYRLTEGLSISDIICIESGAVHTEANTYNFIVHGGPPNTQVHATIHFTYDANGQLVADHFEIRSDCT